MTKRKTYKFRHGEIIDVEEYHDGNYGAPGRKRKKREKPTSEQMQKVNSLNKTRRCRHRMLSYFNFGDLFLTLTYEAKNKPKDMKGALKGFQKFIRIVRREYAKKGMELFWIRNIELGTKGGWHIHLIVNEIGGSADIVKNAWEHGGIYSVEIRKSKFYDEDFTKLSGYMTKDENTKEYKSDGTLAKTKIKEANYGISRNMPIPEPKVERLIRWNPEPKTKKGYYIVNKIDEKNPITGYDYRRYTMIKIVGALANTNTPGDRRKNE